MKVYRIEHNVQKKGPFQVRGAGCIPMEKIQHASDAIPDVPEDFPRWTESYHLYAFSQLKHLRKCFNVIERRLLSRRNFILACYQVPDCEYGYSGIQCRFNRNKATLLWSKKL